MVKGTKPFQIIKNQSIIFKTFLKLKIMKTNQTNFLTAMSNNEINNLVQEVKETIAIQMPAINHSTAFTAADFWNLERNRKTRVIRRHLV